MADRALKRLRQHRVPAWWLDAKLGIFVHWTIASIPAFAPVDVDIGELVQSGRRDALSFVAVRRVVRELVALPRQSRSRDTTVRSTATAPTSRSRPSGRPGSSAWDPDAWAARFAATGARYVVFVTKHMDGYCLWPTGVRNPHRPGWNCRRDVVGELAEAVRGAGMRFGLYYSGGLDSTFNDRRIGSVAEMLDAVPRGDYPDVRRGPGA